MSPVNDIQNVLFLLKVDLKALQKPFTDEYNFLEIIQKNYISGNPNRMKNHIKEVIFLSYQNLIATKFFFLLSPLFTMHLASYDIYFI